MNKTPLLKYFSFLFLAMWLIVSILAISGLYKLWWERERVNYYGKDVGVQREKIWQIAGFSPALLDAIEQVDKFWPIAVDYTATGDHNQLSYGKYLLLPRIPKGSSQYSINDKGEYLHGSIRTGQEMQKRFWSGGFFLSVLFVWAISRGLKKVLDSLPLSSPELFGIGTLLAMACGLVSRALFGNVTPGFCLFTVLGLISLAFALKEQKNNLKRNIFNKKQYHREGRPRLLVMYWRWVMIGVIVLLVFWSLLMSVIVVPDDWDAWAIWGAKAKVLALGRGSLADVTFFGHGDYPLLWPTLWAYSAWLCGGWEEMLVRGWGAVFLVLCVWEIGVIVLRTIGDRTLAYLAGALFVSMPAVPLIASWSYAETPFWFLTICCFGTMLLRSDENSWKVPVMTGILAVAAAYTKNEGVMYSAIIVIALIVFPSKNHYRDVFLFVVVFGLCYFPWYYWTTVSQHMVSHATSGLHLDFENIRRATGRIPAAAEAIWRIWGDVRQWNIMLWAALTFIAIGLWSREGRRWLLIPVGMLLGYFVIIIFHQAEIYWQVGTSWNRLTIHVMPFLIIGIVCETGRLLIVHRD